MSLGLVQSLGQSGHPADSHPSESQAAVQGRFVDETEKVGVHFKQQASKTSRKYLLETMGSGVAVFDYDNDGRLDIFLANGARIDDPMTKGAIPQKDGPNYWNRLYHQKPDGTFEDVTVKAGLQGSGYSTGVAVGDYDNDGFDDLFVAGYGHSTLYHNNGDGTFTDVSGKSGILKPGPRYSITAVSYDFDNDGWPDIYVAVDSEPSIMFKNNHDGTFTDIAVMSGTAYSDGGHEQAGMGIAVADYDCDGWLDIFKTNFADDTCNLYHNNGDGSYSDVTFSAGVGVNNQYVAWGCGFVDYDNDGWQDIIQINGHVYPEIDSYKFGQTFKNPRLVYRNLGNGHFKDVSVEMGPGISEQFSSRGAAFGDYDNDGDIDVLVLNMNDLPSLLRNEGGNKQNWIKLKLVGTKCNRTAIGARARVITGKHIQLDEVHSGSSVMSQSDLRLHFGLGKAETIELIEVRWPTTQKLETFKQVKANQILTIREGEGIVAAVRPKLT